MSDLSELFTGIVLTCLSFGAVMICIPRHGKKAWFVGVPFLETGVSILVVTGFVLGLLFITAYFTAIDNATLAGIPKHS